MASPEERTHAPKTAEQTGIPEQSTLGQWEVLVQDGEGKQTFKCREAEWENGGEVCVSGGAGGACKRESLPRRAQGCEHQKNQAEHSTRRTLLDMSIIQRRRGEQGAVGPRQTGSRDSWGNFPGMSSRPPAGPKWHKDSVQKPNAVCCRWPPMGIHLPVPTHCLCAAGL